MSREYVFLKCEDKYIECIKVDGESSYIDVLKYEYKKETITDLINFIDRTTVIGYDLSSFLIGLLTDMYEFKIYNCVFRYYDMKDYNENNKLYRVFRGLNYNLYLIDKGYYVYDKSPDKMVSYYIHKKELEKNCNYTDEEYLLLKENGAYIYTLVDMIYNIAFGIVLLVLYYVLVFLLYIIYLIFYSERKYRRRSKFILKS